MDTKVLLVVSLTIYYLLCAVAIALAKKTEAFGKKEDFPEGFGEYFAALFFTFMGPYCIIMLPFACKKLLGKLGDIVELTVWSVTLAILLVWGAYLEYTLWVEDGIIDRLRASTLSNSEVSGWIFSLNASVILWTGFLCSMLGARIGWLLKSRKRRTEMAKRAWGLLPLWVLIGAALCMMAVEVYFHEPIVTALVAVAGAILTALTCMLSKSYQEG